MSDYGTIRIPREAYEKHNDRRKDLGLSWEQYLDREGVSNSGELWTEQELKNLVDRRIEAHVQR